MTSMRQTHHIDSGVLYADMRNDRKGGNRIKLYRILHVEETGELFFIKDLPLFLCNGYRTAYHSDCLRPLIHGVKKDNDEYNSRYLLNLPIPE